MTAKNKRSDRKCFQKPVEVSFLQSRSLSMQAKKYFLLQSYLDDAALTVILKSISLHMEGLESWAQFSLLVSQLSSNKLSLFLSEHLTVYCPETGVMAM